MMAREDEFYAEMATFDRGSLAAMLPPLRDHIAVLQRRLAYVEMILNLNPDPTHEGPTS